MSYGLVFKKTGREIQEAIENRVTSLQLRLEKRKSVP